MATFDDFQKLDIRVGKIVDIDKFGEIEHKGTISVALNEKELQERFDKFIL